MSVGGLVPDAAHPAPSSAAAATRRRLPLSAKLAIALVGLVTLVLIINGALNLWLNYGEAKRAAVQVQQEKAQAAAERVDAFISDLESQIGWTTRAEWRRVPLEQQRYDFIRLLRQAPAVTEVAYLDPTGKEQLKVSRLEPDTVGSGKDFSAEPRFTNAVAEKVWFGPVYFRRGSEPYMTVAVAHAGRNPGVTTAEVNLKLVWDVITAIKVGDKGYAFVVTAAGRLIAHPDLSLVLRDTDLSRLPQVAHALPADGAAKAVAGADPEISADLGGSPVLTAYAPIRRVGWLVFVQSPASEALAPVYRSLTQALTLLGFGLLLATLVGSLLARRMVVPIRRLQEGAERLGGGDLSQRIAIRTGDEIETLADRFNGMAGRLQDSYATLEGKVEERTRELREALEYQTASSEVLGVISRSTADAQPVFEAIVRSAAKLFSPWTANISILKDGELHFMATAASSPEDESAIHKQTATVYPIAFDPERAPSAQAMLERRIIELVDTSRPGTQDYSAKVGAATGFRSMTFVPLLLAEEGIGTIIMTTRAPGQRLAANQKELIQTFADQAVIAIENARLFEEVQARTRELSESLEYQTATSEVLGVISRSPDQLQPVLDAIVAIAARICQATIGDIVLVEGDRIRVAATMGEMARPLGQIPLDRSTVMGRSILEAEPIHVHDLLAEGSEFPSGRKLAVEFGHRTILCVPLLRRGEAIGTIILRRHTVQPFSGKQTTLLKTFADQAVIAINNVGLFEEVQARTAELEASLHDLRTAQDRLVQSEKLASLGQLTAGIAHEIKNPLNFVNNFSSLSCDLIDELNEILAPASLDAKTREEVDELTEMLKGNLEKVVSHGRRADSIVKNMLLHSREGSGDHRSVDVNALVEESLNLAYHGARAEKPGFNVTLVKDFDLAAGQADLYPQEVTRVLLNLIGNGFYAATKRKAEMNGAFEPTLSAATRNLGDRVEIRIRDNGTGIPDEVKAKMFNPFFTTKPAGEGTGLGLSLSHDIVVKQHGGSIDVATEPGAFTEFTIVLPRGGAFAASTEVDR